MANRAEAERNLIESWRQLTAAINAFDTAGPMDLKSTHSIRRAAEKFETMYCVLQIREPDSKLLKGGPK